MSKKREKIRRAALKREYEAELRLWAWNEPPKILFWRWRKWKKSRPIWDKRKRQKYPGWFF